MNSGLWLNSKLVLEAARLKMEHRVAQIERSREDAVAVQPKKTRSLFGRPEVRNTHIRLMDYYLEDPRRLNDYAAAMKLAALAQAGEEMAPGGSVWVSADDFWNIKPFFNRRNEPI